MSELVKFAKAELRRAGLFDADADYDGAVGANVVALMETFCAYGHSGGSAAITLALFSKLADHKPITPLTGEDDEWEIVEHQSKDDLPFRMQNIRCPTVFREGEIAWDTSKGHKPITFPYTVA